MKTPRDPIYAGHRYPTEIISYAVWLYFRFPLSLRMVEEMLAARGISVTHETIRNHPPKAAGWLVSGCGGSVDGRDAPVPRQDVNRRGIVDRLGGGSASKC